MSSVIHENPTVGAKNRSNFTGSSAVNTQAEKELIGHCVLKLTSLLKMGCPCGGHQKIAFINCFLGCLRGGTIRSLDAKSGGAHHTKLKKKPSLRNVGGVEDQCRFKLNARIPSLP